MSSELNTCQCARGPERDFLFCGVYDWSHTASGIHSASSVTSVRLAVWNISTTVLSFIYLVEPTVVS